MSVISIERSYRHGISKNYLIPCKYRYFCATSTTICKHSSSISDILHYAVVIVSSLILTRYYIYFKSNFILDACDNFFFILKFPYACSSYCKYEDIRHSVYCNPKLFECINHNFYSFCTHLIIIYISSNST